MGSLTGPPSIDVVVLIADLALAGLVFELSDLDTAEIPASAHAVT